MSLLDKFLPSYLMNYCPLTSHGLKKMLNQHINNIINNEQCLKQETLKKIKIKCYADPFSTLNK